MTKILNGKIYQFLGRRIFQISPCWNPAIIDKFSYFEDENMTQKYKEFSNKKFFKLAEQFLCLHTVTEAVTKRWTLPAVHKVKE